MKQPILASLLVVFALASCETAHNAAVSTFRVVDAPNAYMRRKLGIDQEQPQTTTTTTTTETTGVYSNTAPYPASRPYPAVQPAPGLPPPPQPQRQIATSERQQQAEPQTEPSASPRIARRENAPPTSSPTPRPATSQNADLPYAKPVPGKPGYVFSPFDKNGGYVDVTGYSPGQKVKDPYTGKIFLVP